MKMLSVLLQILIEKENSSMEKMCINKCIEHKEVFYVFVLKVYMKHLTNMKVSGSENVFSHMNPNIWVQLC